MSVAVGGVEAKIRDKYKYANFIINTTNITCKETYGL